MGPLASDSQLFAVRALPEKSFLSRRGLGGDGDARSSLPGVLSPELSACIGVWRDTYVIYIVRTTGHHA